MTRPHSTNTYNAKVQTINLSKQQNLIRFVLQSHESKASVILCVMNGRCCASVPDVCMCRCLPPPPSAVTTLAPVLALFRRRTCSRSHCGSFTARRPRPRRRPMLRSGSYLQFIFIFFHTLIRILCGYDAGVLLILEVLLECMSVCGGAFSPTHSHQEQMAPAGPGRVRKALLSADVA